MAISEARKRRADELALRYEEQVKMHGCTHPDRKVIFKTAYLCAVHDLEQTIHELESEIMDLKAELNNSRVIAYSDGPYVKVTRPN